MAKTRAELVTRALNKLGAVGAGQAPSPEDSTQVDGTVEAVMDDLAARNVYAWGDPNEIELAAFEHLADCLAVANARDFGQQPDEAVRLLAEKRLIALSPTSVSGQRQTAEYF